MLTSSKNRWALSLLENAKTFVEKSYPKEKILIQHLRDAVMIICLKVQKEEENREKTSVSF